MKVLLIIALLALSGCAVDDYGKYAQTLSAHSTAESNRIAVQSSAILNTVKGKQSSTFTDTESSLLLVIAMQQIGNLEPVELKIQKPKTVNDVWGDAVQMIPGITTAVGMVRMGEKALDQATTSLTSGGDIEIQQSTVTGSTGSGANSTQVPYVVRPEVVYPEVVSPKIIKSSGE